MNECRIYRDLIEQYLDGTLSDTQLAGLKAHAQDCESCRREFERSVRLGETIRDSFSPSLAADRAKASVIARLSEQPQQRTGRSWAAWNRVAVAAGVLLTVGLLAGFALGRAHALRPPEMPPLTEVSARVADLRGTVLVRHQGYDVWNVLTSDSPVYVGDTFHSIAKSNFVLKLEDDSTLQVNQNSMLALTSYNGQTRFFLEHGECTARLESPHGPFFIDTPQCRAQAVGTEFTVTVE